MATRVKGKVTTMPVCFSFRKDDQNIPLDQIDSEICNRINISVDSERFCGMYEIITTIGINMSSQTGFVSVDVFDKYIKDRQQVCKLTEQEIEMFRHFLCGEYIFHSWYSRFT